MKAFIHLTFLALALTCTTVLAGDTWTSIDGESITADFVRMEGNAVVLKMNGQEYTVPMEQLTPQSQGYARYLHEGLKEWAMANLEAPIIPENILLEILASDKRKMAEGKTLLVSGIAASVGRNTSLAANAANLVEVRLQGGTLVQIDFSEEADGRRTKLKFDIDKVELIRGKATVGGGKGTTYHDFTTDKILMARGQAIVIRASVINGRLQGNGLAKEDEVLAAKIAAKQANGGMSMEEALALEEVKIRIKYLEAQLESGTAGTATLRGTGGERARMTIHYTDAQIEAMKQEITVLKAQISAATQQ